VGFGEGLDDVCLMTVYHTTKKGIKTKTVALKSLIEKRRKVNIENVGVGISYDMFGS